MEGSSRSRVMESRSINTVRVLYPDEPTQTNIRGLASTLLSIDLSQNWTNSTVAIHSTTKPDGAPKLNDPSFWYHESEDLIYSGFTGWTSSFGDHPKMPPLSLWTFKPDGTGSGAWNQAIPAGSSAWHQLTRPGLSLMAFDSNSAWILGGTPEAWIGGTSSNDLIPGMVQFDMGSRLFSNFSVECCNATRSIYQGALQYVPSFGPAGIHIAMGGRHSTAGFNGSNSLIDFGTVSVFDPAKRAWWNQTTTGSKPSPRVEFCTAGVNSTNQTYEMLDSKDPGALSVTADDFVDLSMRALVLTSAQCLYNMTPSISSPYRRSTGSAFLTTHRILDMDFLATPLGEVRYSLLEVSTRTQRFLSGIRFRTEKVPSIAPQIRLRRA